MRHDPGGLLDVVGVDVPPPAPTEGGDVALHGDAVELDRPLDQRGVDGDRTCLHGDTEEEQVGRRGVAEQATGDRGSVGVAVGGAARHLGEPPGEHVELWIRRRRLGNHRPGGGRRRRTDDDGPFGPGAGAVRVAGADEEVEGEEAIDPRRVGSVGHRRAGRRDAQIADDWPGLLRQSSLIETAHGSSGKHRRRAEDLADRDHAGAADPGEADDELVGRHCWVGVGQAIGRVTDRRRRRRRGPAGLPPLASTVTRANDGQSPSRQVMSKLQLVWWMRVLRPYSVITGCTDRQLLLSPQSPHPSQTRSLITMRKVGLGERAATAGPAILGGARLVVDQRGHATHRGESLLGLDQPRPIPDLDSGRRVGPKSASP